MSRAAGDRPPVAAFVSGTGPAGYGLAVRLARAGVEVVVGSRAPERAEEARARILAHAPGAAVAAAENAGAVAAGDVVFLTMPPEAQRASVEALADRLAGKVVVSMANPLTVREGRVETWFPAAGSLAEEAAAVAPGARVVGAFHEIHVRRLARVDRRIDADTIVTGDDPEAKRQVMGLARLVEGLRPVDGGPLANTRYVEGFVAVLVSINLRYRAATSLRIVGLPEGA
jgi:NADPH-dependent F420 reductase